MFVTASRRSGLVAAFDGVVQGVAHASRACFWLRIVSVSGNADWFDFFCRSVFGLGSYSFVRFSISQFLGCPVSAPTYILRGAPSRAITRCGGG